MKTSVRWLGAARLAVLALLFLFCCSDPVEDEVPPKEEEENEEEFTPDDADAVLEAFSFTAVTKVTGSVPAVTNTSLIKTSSKDTIYTMPGIKDLIRISHPESRPVKGIFFAAKGSSFYYDVPIDTEEKSDTVSVILFEIDPEKIDKISSGPVEIPIEITAYDDNGQPIDIVERILTVENPSDNSCDVLEQSWHWEWSVVLNMNDQLVNLNARGETYPNNFTFKDCCLGSSCPKYDANQQPYYDVEIPISLFYSIAYEWFEFYSDGLFYRETMERSAFISNPGEDPYTFDPCAWEPVISIKSDLVSYYGTHDYVPGNTSISYGITDDSCGDDFGCGYGSRGGQLITSCHSMLIVHGTEGQKTMRMYTRSTSGQFENELLDRLTFWL